MLEAALLDPDKGITVKDMHYLHGTWEEVCIWSTVDIRHGTVLPWFACITAQSVSQEMRLSLSPNESTGYCEHKLHSYSRGLSGFSYLFITCHVFPFSGWKSWFRRLLGPVEIHSPFFFLISAEASLPFITMATPQQLIIMTHWRWLLFWLFIWIVFFLKITILC